MKNVFSEHKEIELWKKKHFVENKRDYAMCIKTIVNFPVA
jgi:hypothetical protein